MAIFFFSIGLEIKREILKGELSSFRQALMPILAAIGGMAIPIALFAIMSYGTTYTAGAAIPMATDIAFSLGVLAMLGSRVPISMKVFLTTLAVVDDIGGIILYATCILLTLLLGSILHIKSKVFYLTLGGVVWFLFLNSGIHPTIAGVLVAFCVPATPVFAPRKYIKTIRRTIANFKTEDDETLNKRSILDKRQLNWLKEIESASDKVISPLQELEDSLHPIVNFFIVPLFAFANAGIFLLDINPSTIVSGISLAIIIGLVIGKFLGIFIFSWVAIKLRLASMPQNMTWKSLASVSILGGIGFTVSLFIANLSFPSPIDHSLLENAKLGIIIGSLLSGILGFILLQISLPHTPADRIR